MKAYIEERAKNIADRCVEAELTVRQLAEIHHVSKSTVHKDLTERLLKIDPKRYREVKRVLEKNKSERSIRGGEATRLKYLLKKGSL